MTDDPEDMDEDARVDAHDRRATPPLSGLRAYSTAAMYAEIARRRDARVQRSPISKCEECRHFQHFKPLEPQGGQGVSALIEPPNGYNACLKRHMMSFRMPDSDDGPADQNDDWGFYRRACADRDA